MSGKLAINGGEKAVNWDGPHFCWPRITDKTKQAVLAQMDDTLSIYNRSGIFEKVEDRFAKYVGKKHALLTNSGTSALHSLFVGANLKEGDEVICPAYTFYATVMPLFFTGAIPVLAESGVDGNIDPKDIEAKITDKTQGIMVTHMWSIPCKMDEITSIARKHDLLLFEDGSHAHGSTYQGKQVGSFGDASAFSLQGQKTLTGGEGGILVTDNDEIFYRALMLGHYNKRCKTEIPKDHPLHRYAVTGMGLKLRAHPLAIAIADEQFDNLEEVIEGRGRTVEKMMKRFSQFQGIENPRVPKESKPSWYAMVMQYKPEEMNGVPIERFYEALVAEGCEELDRPGSTCPLNLHPTFQDPSCLFPGYKGKISYKEGDFPVAEVFHKNTLKLPVHDREEDHLLVDMYLNAFEKVITHHKELMS